MDSARKHAVEGWDLNKERTFLENLLQQRFNFLVVVFGLVVVGGTAANSRSELNWVLAIGFLLCAMLGLATYRVFTKVDAVLRMIHTIKDHAMHAVALEAKKRRWPLSIRVNDILGYVVPVFCLLVILVWAVLANVGAIACWTPECQSVSPRATFNTIADHARVAGFELDYEAFDQQPRGGWRKLAESGKYLEAARLIDAYEKNKEELKDWQRRNLRFHAGQLYAFAGQNEGALARFKSAMNPDEPEEALTRWNAYVKATIAFLERDWQKLTELREEIARGPKLQGKVANLDVVDRLIANFGSSYSAAYSGDKRMSPE